MNSKSKIIIGLVAFSVTAVTVSSAQRIYAHLDNSLAHELAVRFNLHESDVQHFLDDYYHERLNHIDDNRNTNSTNNNWNNNRSSTSQNNRENNEDDNTDTMFTDHLAFVDHKLSKGVSDGWINNDQRKATLVKLREMMNNGPTASQYRSMNSDDLNDRINTWKSEMRRWAREHNLTLDQIRNLTGKGNKYLMGVELE